MVLQPPRGRATQLAVGHLAGFPSISGRIPFATGNSPAGNMLVHALPPGRGTEAPPEHTEVPPRASPKPEETRGYHQARVFPRLTPGCSALQAASRQCGSQRGGQAAARHRHTNTQGSVQQTVRKTGQASTAPHTRKRVSERISTASKGRLVNQVRYVPWTESL